MKTSVVDSTRGSPTGILSSLSKPTLRQLPDSWPEDLRYETNLAGRTGSERFSSFPLLSSLAPPPRLDYSREFSLCPRARQCWRTLVTVFFFRRFFFVFRRENKFASGTNVLE